MATANETLEVCILEYQAMLLQIELFKKDNPDNVKGYNALIDVAERIQLRASAAGFTKLPPLPEKE
jgi:hypothetical protein